MTQRWKHGATSEQQQGYTYDNAQRLLSWSMGTDVTSYSYDAVGNRTGVSYMNPLPAGTDQYQYIAAGRPNGLSDLKEKDAANVVQRWTTYGYNGNGAIVDRFRRTAGGTILKEEHLTYSYRELLRRYLIGPEANKHQEWTYRYSPTGEREQKRLSFAANGGHSAGDRLGWVYYLLGGSKEQLAVYHGQESIAGPECSEGGNDKRVYVYPVEYNTGGSGRRQIITTPDAVIPSGQKQYVVADHLGSTRVVVGQTGAVKSIHDYEPFGTAISGAGQRRTFIDKEQDRESDLGDFGARKYEPETGRFLSADPKWEAYTGLSPYSYSANNPLRIVDPTGLTLGYADQNSHDKLDPSGRLAAKAEQSLGDSKHTSIFHVLNDERPVTLGFGNPTGGHAGQAIPIFAEDGSISGVTLLIDEKQWNGMNEEARVRLITHELKHAGDLLSDRGLDMLREHQSEVANKVDYEDRKLELSAKNYASDIVREFKSLGAQVYNPDNKALDISHWWKPTVPVR